MENKTFYSIILCIVFVIPGIIMSIYTIDQGERGVVLRNGAFKYIADPGLHFKLPVFDGVKILSTQSRKATYTVDSYSFDQQPAKILFSVNYRLDIASLDLVYENYGSEEALISRLIEPRAQQELKATFGKFTAMAAIQSREKLTISVFEALTKAINGIVFIDGVQIENIDFSDAYELSVEQRMMAEVEVQKFTQNLEREKIEAQIVITRANAEAESIKAKGFAEAESIKARGVAIRENSSIVELVQAERWNGVLPSTMIPSSTLPIIGAGK